MKAHRKQKGFSLLELLVVMSIMAMLATLASAGYFSAVHGIAKQRAASGVVNALVFARQRACSDATKTVVIFYNAWSGAEMDTSSTTEKRKAARASYVICKAIGQFTSVQGDLLGDEFSPVDRLFGISQNFPPSSSVAPIRLYNLTRGGWSDVYQTVKRDPYPGSSKFDSPATGASLNAPAVLLQFKAKRTVPPDCWKIGDSYGVAVSPVATLPKNIYFGSGLTPWDEDKGGTTTRPRLMYEFFPDGSAKGLNEGIVLKSLDPDLKVFRRVKVSKDGEVTQTKN